MGAPKWRARPAVIKDPQVPGTRAVISQPIEPPKSNGTTARTAVSPFDDDEQTLSMMLSLRERLLRENPEAVELLDEAIKTVENRMLGRKL